MQEDKRQQRIERENRRKDMTPGSQWEAQQDYSDEDDEQQPRCKRTKLNIGYKRKSKVQYSNVPVNDRVEQLRKRIKGRQEESEEQKCQKRQTVTYQLNDGLDSQTTDIYDISDCNNAEGCNNVQLAQLIDSDDEDWYAQDYAQKDHREQRLWIEQVEDKYYQWLSTEEPWSQMVKRLKATESGSETNSERVKEA